MEKEKLLQAPLGGDCNEGVKARPGQDVTMRIKVTLLFILSASLIVVVDKSIIIMMMILLSRPRCLSQTGEGRSSLTGLPSRSALGSQMQRLWWRNNKDTNMCHNLTMVATIFMTHGHGQVLGLERTVTGTCTDEKRLLLLGPSLAYGSTIILFITIIIHCIDMMMMSDAAGQRATEMVRFLQTQRSPSRLRLSESETRSRFAFFQLLPFLTDSTQWIWSQLLTPRTLTSDWVSWKSWLQALRAFQMDVDSQFQCLQSEIQSHIIARKQLQHISVFHKLIRSHGNQNPNSFVVKSISLL